MCYKGGVAIREPHACGCLGIEVTNVLEVCCVFVRACESEDVEGR